MNMNAQTNLVYKHMVKTGPDGITARDAMADYGITSATLARRICDIEEAGVEITRIRKKHPIHGRRYTKYVIANLQAEGV